MGAMCSPESVKRWRTPSALSIRTSSWAPVAVPIRTSLRFELAHRDGVGRPPGGALDARFVRGSSRRRTVEDGPAAAGGKQLQLEARQRVAGGEDRVLGRRRPGALEGDADHERVLQRAGAELCDGLGAGNGAGEGRGV